jgi:hypothetical protein
MIIPSFGLTATERVLPKMALDFTTASLDPRVTFTRAGNTATVVNSSGFVAPINADLPRFDFDPITLACKGLLIEESRTNIVFDSAFSTIGSTVVNNQWYEQLAELDCTVNFANSPANTQTAALLAINVSTVAKFIQYRSATTTATTQTFSVFAKANSTDTFFTIALAGDPTLVSFVRCTFTLTDNGTATFQAATGTAVQASAPTITRYGNGWYRCTLQATFTAPTGITALVYPGLFNSQTTASQTLVWGAQIETGAFATSYIPTEATTVTRNADVATMTGTNFSDWFNASEGTFKVLYQRPIAILNSFEFQVSDGSFNNILACYTDAANQIGIVNSGGSAVAAFNYASGVGTNNAINTKTLAYKLNSFAASINGGTTLTDVSGAVPVAPIRLNIGVFLTTQYLNGYIKQIAYWPQRLINNEVQAFSK